MAALSNTARDPVLSLFQSAAAAVGRQLGGMSQPTAPHPLPAAAAQLVAGHTGGAPPAPPPAAPPAALTCAELGLQLLRATIAGDHAAQTALQDRLSFSSCDPLWAKTLLDYGRLYFPNGTRPPIPYIHYTALTDFVLPAPRPALRVALVSDWGTGTDEARQVAVLMARQSPDIVIHLGDIYFSGTSEECTLHFLDPMRAAFPDTPLFSLCGNHDVYSGGAGYYGLLRQIGQPASYFCLRSPDASWQILAADTGLNDRNPFEETTSLTRLEPAEEAWHADKLRGFPGLTVFLTHHEPFSSFRQIGPLEQHSPVNPNLMASYQRIIAGGRIDAWFWGHEHSLRLYAPYRGVAAGRNIGYGAIPVDASAEPGATMAGLVDPPATLVDVKLAAVDGVFTHGFALLDLSPAGIAASYWALTRPDGPIHTETIATARPPTA